MREKEARSKNTLNFKIRTLHLLTATVRLDSVKGLKLSKIKSRGDRKQFMRREVTLNFRRDSLRKRLLSIDSCQLRYIRTAVNINI